MDFSGIDPEELNRILSSLSQKDVENIMGLAADLFSGEKGQEQCQEEKEEKCESPFDFDINTVMRIASLINKLSSQPEDPRCRLLRDLKPMLSPDRQKKVDAVIQMLRLMSVIPLFKELEF